MRYASVCSGIEAATVAWHMLGWQPVWFSQYDPENNYNKKLDFPSQVLAHHYPDVPNLGDMTKLNQNPIYHETEFDVLVGGTPCQAFSMAGLRTGLRDERSNLAFEYVRILRDKRPRWFVWENVPGVFTSGAGADFACLLSAWTGQDIEPQKFTRGGLSKQKTIPIIQSHGAFLIADISECHRDAGVYLLSDILERTGDHLLRYCLSVKACAGILRRAVNKGKVLPEILRKALTIVVNGGGISGGTEAIQAQQ